LESNKIAFIVNPNSSNGSTGKEWPQIHAKAKDILGSFTTLMTTGQRHATGLARQAIDSGAEIVVCVGGDGTLNEVINGFVNQNGSIEQGVLLAFIPRGTGCDFVKSISIPGDPDRAGQQLDDFKGRYPESPRLLEARYYQAVCYIASEIYKDEEKYVLALKILDTFRTQDRNAPEFDSPWTPPALGLRQQVRDILGLPRD